MKTKHKTVKLSSMADLSGLFVTLDMDQVPKIAPNAYTWPIEKITVNEAITRYSSHLTEEDINAIKESQAIPKPEPAKDYIPYPLMMEDKNTKPDTFTFGIMDMGANHPTFTPYDQAMREQEETARKIHSQIEKEFLFSTKPKE